MNALIPFIGSFLTNHLLKKSTVEGAVVGVAAAAGSGLTPLEPGSLEYFVVMGIAAVIGIYRIVKKG